MIFLICQKALSLTKLEIEFITTLYTLFKGFFFYPFIASSSRYPPYYFSFLKFFFHKFSCWNQNFQNYISKIDIGLSIISLKNVSSALKKSHFFNEYSCSFSLKINSLNSHVGISSYDNSWKRVFLSFIFILSFVFSNMVAKKCLRVKKYKIS